MNQVPRYLVAKYISDLQRMEPKNIGVVVFAGDAFYARFIAEKPEFPGDIDGRSVPPFVSSTAAYRQWVDFWRNELLIPMKHPEDRIENIKNASRGNFWLVDGGEILDDIKSRHLSQLTNDLFHRLVDPRIWDEPRDLALDEVADDVIRKLQLAKNPSFHTRFEVACRVGPSVSERFEFSHAYKSDRLQRLYQRVPLARRPTALRRAVHDSAWMFEKVVHEGIVEREHAIALVYATEEHRRDPEVSWSFDVLSSVARVANLADSTEAVAAFIVD